MTKSIRQMITAGEVRRADAIKVRLEDIHEEPGFNLRTEGESLEASISALAEFIANGGVIPPLEIRPRADGGVWLVDGHRRRRALIKLDQAGRLPRLPSKENPKVTEYWVDVRMFEGSDADRVARIISSQENEKLSPLELAEGYKRLRAFGWPVEQIAKKVGKTRQHVEQVMTLGNANTDVQQLVASGQVSATTAVQIVRQYGEEAGKVLGGELQKAKATGKSKVTAGSMRGPTTPRQRLEAIRTAAQELIKTLPEGSLESSGAVLSLPADLVLKLHQAITAANQGV
ncbi:ParB N-terminal domain-containing protein [Pseudomonas sp. MSSRFD41]|uniref:ParB/RepB/Spo0J family partition protein n=1 Tax=Pseudomonas sp. MSSRFD41 TaxID=1310370 RepID=UPI00163A6C28|nr:ParB N-terminal domain-containing protein [Pseudomonas sp. MSSRFD41]MBC2658589.1 ParB N-terminal domain-containing protein [Pseudomonas sp. MSSRFD41]